MFCVKENISDIMSISNKVPNPESERITTILKMSISASLASLGIVLSSFVIFVPNFEFISVTIFLIALLLGFRYGIISAMMLSLVYELIVTPIFGSAGLLIPVKLLCYGILALLGGTMRQVFLKLSFWELGVFGALFACFYDILTTIFGQLVIIQEQITWNHLLTVLIFGIPFTVTHIVGNFVLFSMIKSMINRIESAFKYKGVKFFLISDASESSGNIETACEENKK